jgi:branched-chain amino acid transport system ATP-binding protein
MIQRGIVYMPQKKNGCEEFTVEENLLTSAAIYPKAEARERVQKVYEILPILETMRKRTPFNMSGGERQLLAFGNVLVHSPKLILLDEPFAGVDAGNSETLRNCITDLNEKEVTFIIVEHKRQLIDGIVNKIIRLELGNIK